jgi:peptidoglycan glycosyltransferase
MDDELSPVDELNVLSQLQNLNRALMVGFIAVGLALVYWSVIRAPGLQAREDNPRLVEAEFRIQRGRILDRNGTVLAETTGPEDRLERHYPVAHIGPVVGYYSFRHGTSGAEESFDDLLRGESDDFWTIVGRQLLHQAQTGHDVRLTVDVGLQAAADSLLGDETGAILLLGLPDAEILALASHPGYDPNELDERFEVLVDDEGAPLLNRVTQGQYQPGLVLQPLILAAVLEQGLVDLDDPVPDPARPVQINGIDTGCAVRPQDQVTWVDVLALRCPGPAADLGERLGAEGLDRIFEDFGLTAAPQIPLVVESAEPEPVEYAGLAGVGQENLTVSPLQIGRAWAALGIDGRLPVLQLVDAVQDEEGKWQPGGETGFLNTAVSPATTVALRDAILVDGERLEFSTLVLAGPEETTNAWYLGLAPAEAPAYAVVVIVEGSRDTVAAKGIGRSLLTLAVAE